MNALIGIFDFCIRMVPGGLLGAFLFFALYTKRMNKLQSQGLYSLLIREFFLFLFFLFCGGLSILTLTPRWFHWLKLLQNPQIDFPAFFNFGTANLTPFSTFKPDSWSLMILAGNILMFVPLGFFPALFSSLFTFRKAFLAAPFVSLFIECWQLMIGRSFDIDDLILNTCGFLLGRVLLCILPPALISLFRPQPLN